MSTLVGMSTGHYLVLVWLVSILYLVYAADLLKSRRLSASKLYKFLGLCLKMSAIVLSLYMLHHLCVLLLEAFLKAHTK